MIPENWKATQAGVIHDNGHAWRAYRTPRGYARYCEELGIATWQNSNLSCHFASVDGVTILSPRTGKPHRFTTQKGAMHAAYTKRMTTQENDNAK